MATWALDYLLAQGEPISAVLILHLSPEDPRVQRALEQLSEAFAGDRYAGRPVSYRRLTLESRGRALDAISDAQEAESVWVLARDLVGELKRIGRRLHVCIAGGPRILALTLTNALMLQGDHRDRLWHLYTPRPFMEAARDGAILHAPPDAGVKLIPVPLAPLGAYFPQLQALARPQSPPPPGSLLDTMRCQAVWDHLKPREREVLRVLAQGPTLQEAAAQLGIVLKTLDSHKTSILAECRAAWELPDDAHLTYYFLREKFGPWFTLT